MGLELVGYESGLKIKELNERIIYSKEDLVKNNLEMWQNN